MPTTGTTPTTTLPRCEDTARCPRDLGPRLADQHVDGIEVTDLTDAGEVVGLGYTNGEIVSFRLPATGPVRLLRGAPGDHEAVAFAGTTAGLAVGYADDDEADLARRAVAWDGTGRRRDLADQLPTFGGRLIDSTAWDVNERGVAVGSYTLAFERSQPPTTTTTTTRPGARTTTPPPPAPYREAHLAFVWDSATDRVTVLNPQAATTAEPERWATAVAITDNGIIGGHLEPAAMRWRPRAGGGYGAENLGNGFVTAVNRAGDAVGHADRPDLAGTAALWPGDGSGPVALPNRPGGPKGIPEALEINDAGVIAGNVHGEDGRALPIRWPDRATRPPDALHPDGSFSAPARALNAAGAVAAAGNAPDGRPGWRLLVWDP